MEADGYNYKGFHESKCLYAFEDWYLSIKVYMGFLRLIQIYQSQNEIVYQNRGAALLKELVALILILDEGNKDYVFQSMIESAQVVLYQ